MATTKKFQEPKAEKKLVSDQYHEVKYVADKFNVPAWVVYRVKFDMKTNERKLIEQALKKMTAKGVVGVDTYFQEGQ